MRKLSEDERYMRQAITLAKKAAANGDVPIGCVIVYEGKVIARGYNRRNVDKTTLAHAEIMAIKKASKVLGDSAGGLHNVCDVGALPDVCRGDRAGSDSEGRDRMYESEGRMCRFHFKSA